jgi:hypothetical protein
MAEKFHIDLVKGLPGEQEALLDAGHDPIFKTIIESPAYSIYQLGASLLS